MATPPPIRRALGLDLGEARVGVAVSDDLGLFAHPRETIRLPPQTPRRDQAILARLQELIARDKIGVVVIGLPRNMNGTEGPASAKSRAFAELVRAGTACEVRLIDERLTTVAAQRALHESGKNVQKSRAVIDQVAAQMILQIYLDGEQNKSGFVSGGL
jgi:putative Holliday junction resolvase